MITKLVLEYPWNFDEDIGTASYVKDWQQINRIIQDASQWHYFLHSTKKY